MVITFKTLFEKINDLFSSITKLLVVFYSFLIKKIIYLI